MVRDVRIKSYNFPIGSLTADANGRYSVYSEYPLNGTIQNVTILDTNYTATGSVMLFESGLGNSGTALNGQILKIRAGSENSTFYPVTYGELSNNVTGSPQAFTQHVIQSTLRIVGSGLGNGTSGIGLRIYYI